jgi:ABC-type multidrug transport system fused ATPase/permease subunit
MNQAIQVYQQRAETYQSEIQVLDRALRSLSTQRLLAFVASAILILVLANARMAALVVFIAPLCALGFSFLLKRYNQLDYQRNHTSYLWQINQEELLRLDNKLESLADGQTFMPSHHAYVADMDIFGAHSLFQLLNRATTQSGTHLLAQWLLEPAAKEVIVERQQAIQELSPNIDWRQHFQASGMHFQNTQSNYSRLLAWLDIPVALLPYQTRYLLVCLPLAMLATILAGYFFVQLFATPSYWLQAFIALVAICTVNARILKKIRPTAEEIIDSTHHNVTILAGYQSLIRAIESQPFQSDRLQLLQGALKEKGYSAAGEIRKLKNILEIAKQRGTSKQIGRNMIYSIFNTLWLLDIYWILAVEKWKNTNKHRLGAWAAAISEFEVLSSLAAFSYSNPTYSFAHIQDQPYCLDFERMGHPLISEQSRVYNESRLDSRGQIIIITGSNMAGKSTFLRTVGVNLVLALMGAPCCARAARVSPMQLFSSMRTQDNLAEGYSSFYAELKRIEQLLALLASGQTIFFLLDEMFKGTNSQDRYLGGVSLIKQLSELNAFGMISTHDLELAKLAAKHLKVANFSFTSEIREGQMKFDYRLKEGICQDFNASELMKRSGIKILTSVTQL